MTDHLPADPVRLSRGYGEVLRLSAPTSLALLSVTIVRFIDRLMVSRLGPHVLSSIQVAGLTSFMIEAFAFGTLGILSTFVGQSLGEGRPRRCGRYAWAAIRLAMAYALIMLPLLFLAPRAMAMFGHGPETQRLETLYLRYMVISFLLTMPARAIEMFFIGVHRPRVVVIAVVIANVINVGLNYVLIFGKLGMPALGLEGAAIGSCISWAIQLAILLGVFLSRRYARLYGTRTFRFSQRHLYAQILRRGMPVGARLFNAMICWNIFTNYLVGGFGPAYLAGNSAVATYALIITLPLVGVATAVTALVGRYIGARRPDLARKRVHTALLISLVYLTCVGSVAIVLRRPLVRAFIIKKPFAAQTARAPIDAPEAAPATRSALTDADRADAARALQIGATLMLPMLLVQVFDCLSILYTGALRGAGDTFLPMAVVMALAWVLEVGGGALMATFLPQLEAVGPYLAAAVYLACAGAYLCWRFESGGWRSINIFDSRRQRTFDT